MKLTKKTFFMMFVVDSHLVPTGLIREDDGNKLFSFSQSLGKGFIFEDKKLPLTVTRGDN